MIKLPSYWVSSFLGRLDILGQSIDWNTTSERCDRWPNLTFFSLIMSLSGTLQQSNWFFYVTLSDKNCRWSDTIDPSSLLHYISVINSALSLIHVSHSFVADTTVKESGIQRAPAYTFGSRYVVRSWEICQRLLPIKRLWPLGLRRKTSATCFWLTSTSIFLTWILVL